MKLFESMNNIVIITDVVAIDHFFVHNASSPDYMWIPCLNDKINDKYKNSNEDIPEINLRTVTHGTF